MALRERCGDFVGFAFRCGIGKPAPDPTLDAAQQASADLMVWQSVSDLCSQGKPPFDEGLIGCFLSAGGDCDRYRTCAERVVQSRGASAR